MTKIKKNPERSGFYYIPPPNEACSPESERDRCHRVGQVTGAETLGQERKSETLVFAKSETKNVSLPQMKIL